MTINQSEEDAGMTKQVHLLKSFLSIEYEFSSGVTVTKGVLYGAYSSFVLENGALPLSIYNFGSRLKATTLVQEYRKKSARYWLGIRLKNNEEASNSTSKLDVASSVERAQIIAVSKSNSSVFLPMPREDAVNELMRRNLLGEWAERTI